MYKRYIALTAVVVMVSVISSELGDRRETTEDRRQEPEVRNVGPVF
jgi:hypothetical protein